MSLTEKQKEAIEKILEKKSEKEILESLKIGRATFWRWQKQNEEFKKELEKKKQNGENNDQEKIKKIISKSFAIILEALEKKDLKVAINILRLYKDLSKKIEDKESLEDVLNDVIGNEKE